MSEVALLNPREQYALVEDIMKEMDKHIRRKQDVILNNRVNDYVEYRAAQAEYAILTVVRDNIETIVKKHTER